MSSGTKLSYFDESIQRVQFTPMPRHMSYLDKTFTKKIDKDDDKTVSYSS